MSLCPVRGPREESGSLAAMRIERTSRRKTFGIITAATLGRARWLRRSHDGVVIRKGELMNILKEEKGAIGWILLWLIGIPVPLLILFFLVRGCT
jgi:hypothetical protein